MIRNKLRHRKCYLVATFTYFLKIDTYCHQPQQFVLVWRYFNSICNLWVFCCVYLNPGEVFLILIFANFGIISKFKHCLLKYVLTLHSNILCFKFLYLLMMPLWLPAIILQKQFTKYGKFSVMSCLTESFAFFFDWAIHNGMYSVQLETVLLILCIPFPFQAVGRLQYHRNWVVTWLRQMPG